MTRHRHHAFPLAPLTRRQVVAGGAALVAATTLGCSPSKPPSSGLERVSLRLNWTPSGEHAIYYLGIEQGFYAAESIELSIEPGTGSIDAVKLVGAGNDTFGTAVADAVAIGRSRGAKVTSLAVLLQRSANVLCSLKATGIVTPADLRGKTVGVNVRSTSHAFWIALRKATQLDENQVRTLDLGAAAPGGPLVAGTIDAAMLLATNEMKALQTQGVELNTIDPVDFGVRSYGQVLFTTDQLVRTNPDLARRMTRATLRSLAYALDNVPQAVAALKHRAPEIDTTIETAKWSEIAPRVLASNDAQQTPLGSQSVAGWDATIETFRNAGLIDTPVSAAELIGNLS